jgi:anti-sigma B factor antagonist
MRLADVKYDGIERGIVIARVSGEIDMSNSSDIATAIARSTPNDAVGVVLDLNDIAYLDSAGIQMLYRLRNDLRNRGQQLALVIGPASPVLDVLRLAGVTDVVEIHAVLQPALDALDPPERDRAPA